MGRSSAKWCSIPSNAEGHSAQATGCGLPFPDVDSICTLNKAPRELSFESQRDEQAAAPFVGERVSGLRFDLYRTVKRHLGQRLEDLATGPSFLNAALRVFLALVVCTPCPVIAGPAQSSVWIEVSREDGVLFNGYRLPREGEGMGVVTLSREIATAAHVVWRAKVITVTDAKGAKVPARVARIDKSVDVAILRVERRLDHFAVIRSKPAVTGERVGVVERPAPDEAPNIASGFIGATKWTTNGVPVPLIFSGIRGEKGMSGGGLFDATGELLGIVIRIESSLGYLSALPVTELCTRFSRCPASPR
jgi:S1-C subfamily serine protease